MNRKPEAFVLEPQKTRPAAATKSARKTGRTTVQFDPETDDLPALITQTNSSYVRQRRLRWSTILVSALLALAGLWAGLAITELIEGFFSRSQWLGWLALSVASLAGLAAIAIIVREIWGLYSLNQIESLQTQAARAINLNERSAANDTISGLQQLYAGRSDMNRPLQDLASHGQDIMDPRDRVRLASRLLLEQADEEAHRIIARRARRVTLLTTVTPAAALDILFVATQNFGLLREIAALYGGRPSTLSTLKLGRMVITHLAVAGGLALSDSLIQHLVGKGIMGRLSARFGEGAVNGILTSRIGLAAMDVCRPIPSEKPAREALGKLLREIVSFGEKGKTDAPEQS